MTVDQLVAQVAAQLDDVCTRRLDAFELSLIECGVNPNDRGDVSGPPPSSLPPGVCWQRLPFDEAVALQKARDRQWRAETLGRVRARIEDFLAGLETVK
ncbi:MAG: hypothetical protein ABJA98_17580 [Acidobacteriota bacterium]